MASGKLDVKILNVKYIMILLVDSYHTIHLTCITVSSIELILKVSCVYRTLIMPIKVGMAKEEIRAIYYICRLKNNYM